MYKYILQNTYWTRGRLKVRMCPCLAEINKTPYPVFLEMGNFPNFGDFEGPIGIFFVGIPHPNNGEFHL